MTQARRQAILVSAVSHLQSLCQSWGAPLALVGPLAALPSWQPQTSRGPVSEGGSAETLVQGPLASAVGQLSGRYVLLQQCDAVVAVVEPYGGHEQQVDVFRLLVCWQRCTPAQLSGGEPEVAAVSTMVTVLHTAGLLRQLAEAWLGGAEAGAMCSLLLMGFVVISSLSRACCVGGGGVGQGAQPARARGSEC